MESVLSMYKVHLDRLHSDSPARLFSVFPPTLNRHECLCHCSIRLVNIHLFRLVIPCRLGDALECYCTH